MSGLPRYFQRLADELAKLPSVGNKTALRLAYHIVASSPRDGELLAESIREAISSVGFCSRCFFFSDSDKCSICSNTSREGSTICVVEKPMDVLAIERMGEYRGLYHVLHGVWAPLRGIGPEKLKIGELRERVSNEQVTEVILATSSTVEGDATATYIAKILTASSISVSRLAQGMPKGGELEYADDLTLSRAISGRSRLTSLS